jgi:protein O-GlcNAc transferase
VTADILALKRIASDAERSGDLESAFQAWQELSAKTGKAVHHCRVGRIAAKLGKWPEAEAALRLALDLSPGFSVAMAMIGSLFLERGDGERTRNLQMAKVWISRSLEIERLAPTLSLLATVQYRLGEKLAAKGTWLAALREDDTYEEAYFSLGVLAAEERDETQAEALLRRATDLDPVFFNAHGRLGELLQTQGRYSEAESEFRRCVEIDSSAYFAHAQLADALGAQGRVTEAEQEYRVALGIRPGFEPVITKFANYLESLSRNEEADELRSQQTP